MEAAPTISVVSLFLNADIVVKGVLILLLAASQGTRIVVTASGEDEADAITAVEDLITRSFDEEE